MSSDGERATTGASDRERERQRPAVRRAAVDGEAAYGERRQDGEESGTDRRFNIVHGLLTSKSKKGQKTCNQEIGR